MWVITVKVDRIEEYYSIKAQNFATTSILIILVNDKYCFSNDPFPGLKIRE